MILAKKVRILPTPEQEQQLWKSAGTARWIYNWALDKQIKHFERTGKLNKLSDSVLRKELTQLKQTEEFAWLYEVSNNVSKQAVKDTCLAIDGFHKESKKHGYRYRASAIKSGKERTFKDYEDFPRFKSRKKSKVSFYHDTEKIKFTEDTVHLEKIGKVLLAANRISVGVKYTNPRISHDGKYWYVSIGIEEIEPIANNTDESIGVDLGLKDLAIVSNIDKPISNINKTKEVKRLKKKLKRKQKQVSRKYESNKIPNEGKGGNR